MKPFRSTILFAAVFIIFLNRTAAQVSVNSDGSSPDSSAMLDVKSSTKGFIVPRMTAEERDAIIKPAKGLMIFCTDNNGFYYNQGTPDIPDWIPITSKLTLNGSTDKIARWISATSLGTGILKDDNSSVGLNCDTDPAYRFKVDGNGSTALKAQFNTSKYGILGDINNGVYGQQSSTRYGALGGTDFGAYGQYSSEKSGYLGHYKNGVFGWNQGSDIGGAGVYGLSSGTEKGIPGVYGKNSANLTGTQLSADSTCNGITGYTSFGTPFHFGVFGSRHDDGSGPSAGVIGTVNNAGPNQPWGALGFQDVSSNEFAGYFSGNILLTGGVNDGTGYGSNGCVLLTNGANDVYWSGSAGILGSGMANYLPKWQNNTTLSNSLIYDDGAEIGIGTISPSYKLHVNSGGSSTSIFGQYSSNIYGYLGSSSYGAYGQNTSTLYGYLGGSSRGAYGQYSSNIFGYLGDATYGSYGQYSSARFGYLGSSSYGAYGQGNSSVYGYLGSTNYGAYGQYNSTIYGFMGSVGIGVYGQYSSTIFGYLGSSQYGVAGAYSGSIWGYIGGAGNGCYGQYSSNRYGSLGNSNYGVWGQYDDNIHGYLGGSTYGAYGQNSSTLFGYLGSSSYGAYGQNSSTLFGYLGGSSNGVYGQYSGTRYGYLGNSSYGAYAQYDANIKGYLGSSSYGAYGQNSSTLFGYLGGGSYGAFGQYSSTRYGYLGSSSYGAYAQYDANIKGYLGNLTYGAYGQYNTDVYGYLGSSSYGVSGNHSSTGGAAGYFYHGGGPASYISQWTIDSYMTNSTANDGSGYGMADHNTGGIRAYSYNGPTYSFSIAGWNYNDDTRCSGVFGSNEGGGYWGALGYKSSGSTLYGGYFTSSTTGTGKRPNSNWAEGIGIGAWGGLMGADIHGGIYGIFVEGDNFGLYSKGAVYAEQPVIQLQDVGEPQKAVLYTNTSTDVTVMTSGMGSLSNGQCSVNFDNNFKKVISAQIPVVITITPMGPSNGLYISSSGHDGFTVTENYGGTSTTSFSFIALGRRAGYENPQVPSDIVATDFESTMIQGLHNDADISTDGKGLYYRNGRLQAGLTPSSMGKPVKK
jgi:hypothetical protein